ncbi:MAG: serine hydrolase domain-containing protein [Candidatus Bathyarchaeia archaeon]
MKKLLMVIPLVILLCFAFSCKKGEEVAEDPAVDVEKQRANFEQLEGYIQEVMRNSEIPGLSISIIMDDSVIFSKGFGVRMAGKDEPVNQNTLFNVASLSKAFTAAGIALLVDSGKLKWDDPVIKHLPQFELYDPYVTQNITIRDMLTMRSGLTGGDSLWAGTNRTRNEVIHEMRNLKPKGQFRLILDAYNIHYLVAGQVVTASASKTWDDFIKERLFVPLKMTSTFSKYEDVQEINNYASPHIVDEGKTQLLQKRDYNNISPAAGVVTNVVDLAQWIRLQLGNGVFEGKRIISDVSMEEMHKPQILAPYWFKDYFNPQALFMTYGMGWGISDYNGLIIIDHGGMVAGFTAYIAMVPSKQLGIVILSNMDNRMTSIVDIKFKAFELFMSKN